MKYVLPKKVRKGDTIGIISLSGVIEDKKSFERGVKKLEEIGYRVKVSERAFDKNHYLAGDDSDKVEELQNFFRSSEIDCILCSRGGFGAIRIIDKIDYSIIRKNPKAFCGYSDVTALSAMILKHAGLATYSSPMVVGDLGAENVSNFTLENFVRALQGEYLEFKLRGDISKETQGICFGGNLTTLASLCGRDFVPTEDFILVIEDVNEPAYKIDRALSQLFSVTDFRQKIVGIVAGDFSEVDSLEDLEWVLNSYSNTLKIPIWYDLKLGHEAEKITMPFGEKCFIKENKIIFQRNT